MDYNFSGVDVLSYLFIISIFIFVLIAVTKYLLNNKYFGLDTITNVFKFRRTILFLSFAVSILVLLIVFNWTIESNAMKAIDTGFLPPDEIEVEIPVTREEPKKIPPPPPEIEVVPEEIDDDDQPEFQPIDIDADEPVEEYTEEFYNEIPEPLPKTERKEVVPDIVSFAEEMPLFPGCDDVTNHEEKRKCSTKKLYEYIYSNIKYPKIAQESYIEGKVTLRFVVDKTGNISKVNILRDIGGGCGQAALKAIENMKNMDKKWIPGKQAGRPVSVWFTLPVVFELSQ